MDSSVKTATRLLKKMIERINQGREGGNQARG